MTDPDPPHPTPSGARGPVVVLFVTVVIDLIGFGIVLPLLPGYAARFDVNETAIGAVVAAFSLMQFVFAPRWGRLSDRIGRRPVLLIGLAGSCLSYLLFAVAGNYWVLLASRLLAGCMGATVSVAQAYLADITPQERRAHAMGLIGAAFGLGFVLGPTIAGLTVGYGAGVPGFVASGLSAGALLLALIMLPETRVHRHSDPAHAPVQTGRLVRPFAVMFLVVLGFAAMNVVFPLYAERAMGYDQRGVAHLFVVAGLASVITQGGLVGRLSRRLGERALIVGGSLLLAAGLAMVPSSGLAVFSPAARGRLLVASMAVIALGTGLCTPSITAFLSRTSPPREQGRVLGMLQSVNSMARIVGPLAAGVLMHLAGVRAPFVLGAGLAAVAGITAVGIEA